MVTFLVALTWPVGAYLFGSPDGVRWIVHATTFGLFHLFILPFAVGTFFSTMRRDELLLTLWPSAARNAALAALAALHLLVGAATIQDAARPGLNSVYLTDPDRSKVYNWENSHRGKPVQTPSPDEVREREQIRQLLGLDGSRNIFTHGNGLAGISVVLNFLFGVFIALYFWTLVTAALGRHLWGRPIPSQNRLLLVFLLLGLWIPLRLYASWYAEHLITNDWFSRYRALKALIVVYGIVGLIWCVVIWKTPRPTTKLAALVVAACGVVSWLLESVAPGIFQQILQTLEQATLVESLIVGIPLLSLIVITVFATLADEQSRLCAQCPAHRIPPQR